jgi:predicted transcriptional regulator
MSTDYLTGAVRRALEDAPCSVRALAKQAGVPHSTLVRIGDGSREATPAVAEAVARALRTWGKRCDQLAQWIEYAAKGD